MKRIILILCYSFFLLQGCHKIPETPLPEQELITTLILSLTDTASVIPTQLFAFRDIDGEGGLEASVDSIIIPAGNVYRASLLLLDERYIPADTITQEIEELGTEHQFFYTPVPALLFPAFTYLDADTNGKPLGNHFLVTASNAPSGGIFKVTLRHQPDKYGANVDQNDIRNAGGETDIEVDFPVRLY